jgi:hypothetical protein
MLFLVNNGLRRQNKAIALSTMLYNDLLLEAGKALK